MKRRVALAGLLSLLVLLASCSSEPTVEQIKTDLIGHTLDIGQIDGWTFSALSEFKQFDIRGKQKQEDVIEYDVTMRLHDFTWDADYLADVLVVYRHVDGKWRIVSIVATLFRQL